MYHGVTIAAIAYIVMTIASGCTVKRTEAPPTDTMNTGQITELPDTVARDTTVAMSDTLPFPITLPLLDAFFADSSFAGELRSRLQLSDAQIDSLRTIARSETAKLTQSDMEDYSGTTSLARSLAEEQIIAVIGAEKTTQLQMLIQQRWAVGIDNTGNIDSTRASTGSDTLATQSGIAKSNAIPTDTRIVVNAPAYRMDLFENGSLVKSYKIGIGYPEFPLPTGLRNASTILFNPTWTPPDEPWVESSRKVEVGKQIKAGSKLNPLGIAKIPIGLPSLIHGGKSPSQLGGFASHGCVGLTDQQMREFAPLLAQLGGASLTDQQIAEYGKDRKTTHPVQLAHAVPVELRYETIVVQSDGLHIYRDVYDNNTNTEMNLRRVLAANGISMEQLSDDERSQATNALTEMSRNAQGKLDTTTAPSDSAISKDTDKRRADSAIGKVTRKVKGRKEVVIPIAALQGKGYPMPMMADTKATAENVRKK